MAVSATRHESQISPRSALYAQESLLRAATQKIKQLKLQLAVAETLKDRLAHAESQCERLTQLQTALARVIQHQKMSLCFLLLCNQQLFRTLFQERAQTREKEDEIRAVHQELTQARKELDELREQQNKNRAVILVGAAVGSAIAPWFGTVAGTAIANSCLEFSQGYDVSQFHRQLSACETRVKELQEKLDSLLK